MFVYELPFLTKSTWHLRVIYLSLLTLTKTNKKLSDTLLIVYRPPDRLLLTAAFVAPQRIISVVFSPQHFPISFCVEKRYQTFILPLQFLGFQVVFYAVLMRTGNNTVYINVKRTGKLVRQYKLKLVQFNLKKKMSTTTTTKQECRKTQPCSSSFAMEWYGNNGRNSVW